MSEAPRRVRRYRFTGYLSREAKFVKLDDVSVGHESFRGMVKGSSLYSYGAEREWKQPMARAFNDFLDNGSSDWAEGLTSSGEWFRIRFSSLEGFDGAWMDAQQYIPKFDALNPLELQILEGLANGLKYAEIFHKLADDLDGETEDQLTSAIYRARKDTDCKTKEELIAKAVALGKSEVRMDEDAE